MSDLPATPPAEPTAVIDAVPAAAPRTRPVPWMPILVGVGGLILVGLVVVIVLLLTRGGTPTALPAPVPSSTPSATPSATRTPTPTPTPTPTQVVAAPAEPAPVEPAPAPAAPLPEKVPLTVGIVSFDARSATSKTIAAECAAVYSKAATDNSWVLVNFTWVTRGMRDGGEIQVNGTYGGSSDLQLIPANGNVLFDIKCFNTDGTVKSTDFTLLMSDGTTRYNRTITVTGAG